MRTKLVNVLYYSLTNYLSYQVMAKDIYITVTLSKVEYRKIFFEQYLIVNGLVALTSQAATLFLYDTLHCHGLKL